jgi:hypothetical protein
VPHCSACVIARSANDDTCIRAASRLLLGGAATQVQVPLAMTGNATALGLLGLCQLGGRLTSASFPEADNFPNLRAPVPCIQTADS